MGAAPLLELVHIGFDGLDVAFRGRACDDLLRSLEEARNRAQAARADAILEVGHEVIAVAETGLRGGYRYRFSTGEDGEVWTVKNDRRETEWNVRVSVRALALALYGFAEVRERLYRRAAALGIALGAESVGRVDIAVDFLAPDLAIVPAAFVAHSHTSKKAFHDAEGVDVHYTGRCVSGVTIGKQPGRQIVVYDKRREAVQRRLWHWFDIWGLERETLVDPVWRVEVRGGKHLLKERWNVTTWEDLEAAWGDIVAESMARVRYTDPGDDDPNVTRRRVHPLWTRAAEAFSGLLQAGGMTRSGLAPGKLIVGKRSVLRHTYQGLIAGLAASYAAIHNMSEHQAEKEIDRHVAASIREYIESDPQRFRRSQQRAATRLIVYEDSHEQTFRATCPGAPGGEGSADLRQAAGGRCSADSDPGDAG